MTKAQTQYTSPSDYEGIALTAIHNISCAVCGASTGWTSWQAALDVGWREFVTCRTTYPICPHCKDRKERAL